MGDVSAVDMSLDDIIRLKKKQQKRPAGFRGGRGVGGRGRGGRGRGGASARGASSTAGPSRVNQANAWPRRGRAASRAAARGGSRGAGRAAFRGARSGAGSSRVAGKVTASLRGRGSLLRQNLAGRVAKARQRLLQSRQTGVAATATGGASLVVGRVGDIRRRLQQRRLQAARAAAAATSRGRRLAAAPDVAAARVAGRLLTSRSALLNRAARAADARQHQRDQRFQAQAAARQLQQALSGLKQPGAERLRVEYVATSAPYGSGSLYSDSLPAAPRLLGHSAARRPAAVAAATAPKAAVAGQFRSDGYASRGWQGSLTSRDFEATSPRVSARSRPSVSVTVPGSSSVPSAAAARSASQQQRQRSAAASVAPARAGGAASSSAAGSAASAAAGRRRELELLGRIKELENELAAARQRRQLEEDAAAIDEDAAGEGPADDGDYEDVAAAEEEEDDDAAEEQAAAVATSQRRLQASASKKAKAVGPSAAVAQQRAGGSSSSSRQVIL